MPAQLAAGFVYNDAGTAINGATVDAFTRNTTTPVQATTTTNASGYWSLSIAAEGRYDFRITNNSSIRWRKYDDQIQATTIEVATLRVRNPAFTFDYDIVPAAITADRQLNLPLITATDTLVTLGLAQTFTAVQTFNENVVVDSALVRWTTGLAMVAADYAVTRDADVTNQLHLNVPTGATFEFSVNDVAQMVVGASSLTGNVVGTGASQVSTGNHTTPAMTATAAGHVPTPPNNTTTFLRGDGVFAAPTAGAFTRAGGNTTEATTTSTTAVDLITVTSLSITTSTPWIMLGSFRRTTGAVTNVGGGLKINATVTGEAVAAGTALFRDQGGTSDTARAGNFLLGPNKILTSYASGLIGVFNAETLQGIFSSPNDTAASPVATITDLIVRGIVGSALVTLAVDEVHVYTYAVS